MEKDIVASKGVKEVTDGVEAMDFEEQNVDGEASKGKNSQSTNIRLLPP